MNKNDDIIKTIKNMLDMREELNLKGDLMKSHNGKIKIYKPEINIIRIDIEEEVKYDI